MKKIILFALLLCLFSPVIFAEESQPGTAGTAGATALPDISLVGNILGGIAQQPDGPYGVIPNANRLSLGTSEVEAVIAGYIYPQASVSTVLSFDSSGVNIEEAFADFLSVLNSFSLKVGKMKAEFGKINILHSHVWPYTDAPLVIQNFFGDSLTGEGISLGYVLPLPVFVKSETGIYDAVDTNSEFVLDQELFTERLSISFDPTDESELELGASGALTKGPYGPGTNDISGSGEELQIGKDDVRIAGADLTLKIWTGTYSRFMLQAEAIYMNRDIAGTIEQGPSGNETVGEEEATSLDRWGSYAYAGYSFSKYLDIGGRYDWAENADIQINKLSKISAIVTERLTEGSFFREEYGYIPEEKSNELLLQFVFGIGPHTHPLQ